MDEKDSQQVDNELETARQDVAAAEERLKAAKANEEASKQEAKTQTRDAIRKLEPKWLFIALLVVCLLSSIVVFVIRTSQNSQVPSSIVTQAELEKTVSVSKLATSKCVYRGVATKMSDDGSKVLYHVYYESSVEATVNIEDISFDIDEESKTVYPILPSPTIERPVVDTSSIEFFEKDASGDMKDAIALCKQDAMNQVENNTAIKDRAERNLRSTVEALTKPLLEHDGYQLSWNAPEEATDSENN